MCLIDLNLKISWKYGIRWEKLREDFDGKLRNFSQIGSSAFMRVNMWHTIKKKNDSKGKRVKWNEIEEQYKNGNQSVAMSKRQLTLQVSSM